MTKLRLALLISGSGTTMEAIINACQSGRLNLEPTLVIASRVEAGGLDKARALGIPTEDVLVISKKEQGENWGQTLVEACQKRNIDMVGQYGWLPLTPALLIEAYQDRMINQHPGPLDPGRADFGGRGMYGRAVHCARLYFVRKTGHDFWTEVTAQRVALEFDRGAVLKTKRIEILPSDDVAILQSRCLLYEHETQIEALADFASGNVTEIKRAEPLVRADELDILTEAKMVATTLYPKG